MRLTLRFDMRRPGPDPELVSMYAAMLDMCVWADGLGFEEVFVGEHHAAEDCYVPSPITLLSAVAARTKQIKVHVSALLVTMYNPLRLAEDLAVLDIISNGRLRMTAGMGYRPHEFEMFGVDFKTRLKTYLENIDVLQKAWTGEPFEYQGRTVRISPRPVQRPGPKIIMGGSTDKAAIRAARMGFDFMPGFPPHYELYQAALRELGKPAAPALPNQAPNFLYVTHDPQRDWEHVAPAVLHGTNTYAKWATERGTGATMYQNLESVAQLQANPIFQVVTPEQCVAFAKSLEPHGELQFQPLFGGLEPQLAWRSLKLFEQEVVPALRRAGLRGSA
jgi:alkanesulfonate monooxygenase SsuD/methylene tetrahydromethanopterin reductase-like flavin-dependent oxidoreductase (luciferase family)